MHTKNKQRILFTLVIVLIYSCNIWVNSEDSDFFYVRNDSADMPVWVNGNKESETFVLVIHGGPGGNSLSFHDYYMFNMMEDDFAFVYWDQRAAGSSMGNSTMEHFSIEQYIEDTDKVIDVINLKYNNPKIFLCGSSWGGTLGTAYLLDSERQNKVSGWIEMNGGHDLQTGMELSRQFVIDYAENRNNKDWNEVLDWYEKNRKITLNNIAKHASYVEEAYGYVPKNETMSGDTFRMMFFSPNNILAMLTNTAYSGLNFDIWDVNFIDQMDQITIPSLVIWGEYDGILPVELAQQAYDVLGTPEDDKYINILPNSGHGPVDRDLDLFHESIIEFVNKYR